MARSRFAALLVAVLAGSASLWAQETLRMQGPDPTTVRLGDTTHAVISIEGSTADPRAFELPKVDGLRLDISAPMRSSQFVYSNGRSSESISVQYQLELQPLREGTFVVPSFPIWTGTKEQRTREIKIEAKRDLTGEQLGWIEVKVEPKTVYVHEPVRLQIDFGVQQGLRLVTGPLNNGQSYSDAEVKAEWLDKMPFGEPIEVPPPRNGQKYIVHGNQAVPVGYEPEFDRGGQTWQHFFFQRAVLPTRVGTFELPAPVLRYQIVRREGQVDFFGQRRGGLSENYFAKGEPITIEVKPIPEAGRPTPFYGAVGRGLTIDAALDRDHVKQGGSVKLTLTVRGQGNLEFLRLPEVDNLKGFHKLGEAEAQRDADKVVVNYDLTPLSTDVTEVPALDWNFFDTTPGVETFVEVKTKPLPLVVQPMAATESLAPLPDAAVKPITPGVDDIFDLPALDGEPRRAFASPAWHGWLAVLGPWLLAVLGLFTFRRLRRAAADVVGQRARGALRHCRQALDRGDDPLDALANYLADRMGVPAAAVITPDLVPRLVAAGLDEAIANEVAQGVEQGTAARYGAGAGLDAATVRDLVQRLEGARLQTFTWLPLVLVPLLGIASARVVSAQAPMQVSTQVPTPAAAVASYRAGNYQQAAADFETLYQQTGDRRYLQSRGNCYFRLGDLPRALWAYESARLGMPRDPDLLADIELVRRRLQLDTGPQGLVAELVTLRSRLTPNERAWWCAFGMGLAAASLVLGWRRVGLRWVGVIVLVPTSWLAIDVLEVFPSPQRAIVLQKVDLVSEPRSGMTTIASVQPGVALSVLGGEQGAFLRVAIGERSGYVPRDHMAIVE